MSPLINATFISNNLISKSLSAADYNPTHDAMLARTLERIALKKEQGLRTPDELWIVDHNDVYTLGQAGKDEHILQQTDTPIIKTDRGGQVTWHGHGQLVLYFLFDLHSLDWSVRNLVSHAEQALEDVLNDCLSQHSLFSNADTDINTDTDTDFHVDADVRINARARRDAPGVYLYSAYNDKNDNLESSNDNLENDSLENDSLAQSDNNNEQTIMLGKIASLGFKIKHGFSYHGIALNINCDLSAFNAINPCGYAGMQMLRLADFIAMNDACVKQKDKQKNEQKHNQEDKPSHALHYEQITQKLIDNIAKRHAGEIELRPIADKSANIVKKIAK